MRLVCPNCGAQYEVPQEVIPTSGRDVQCSDCGTTWFQHHPDHEPVAEEEASTDDWHEEAESVEVEADNAEPNISAEPEPGEEITQDIDEDFGRGNLEDEVDQPAPENVAFTRELDPSVAEVLREEAAIETQARSSEQAGLETQQELGVDSQQTAESQRSQEARERMARLRGDAASEDYDEDLEAELEDQASRRNLLPDIEEINSSLGPDQSAEVVAGAMDPPAQVAAPKSGFRTGFRLAILLAVVALLLYFLAPPLAEAVPVLAEPLGQYHSLIDGWRDALDRMVNDFAASLSEE